MQKKLVAVFPSCVSEYFQHQGEKLEVIIEEKDLYALNYLNSRIRGILAEDSQIMDKLRKGKEVTICKKKNTHMALVFEHMIDH